mmetsp:Transcript_77179/g.218411  ORF Transcript_77179/g.218411 Transcript_77179/m.218411 type:complete len:271 (+) Transcript_77179:570-1382(+)
MRPIASISVPPHSAGWPGARAGATRPAGWGCGPCARSGPSGGPSSSWERQDLACERLCCPADGAAPLLLAAWPAASTGAPAGQTGQSGIAVGWKKSRGAGPRFAGIAAKHQPFCIFDPGLAHMLGWQSTIFMTSESLARPSPGSTRMFQVGRAQIQWQGWQLSSAPSLRAARTMAPELPSLSSLHGCRKSSELWSRLCSASCCTLGHLRTSWSWPGTTTPSLMMMCSGAFWPLRSMAEGRGIRTSGVASFQTSSQRDSRMAFQAIRSSAT